MTQPTRDDWMALSDEEVATLVTPHQLALLISQDGTRRYAYLHDPASRQDWVRYTQVVADATLALIEMCFALGVQTVVVGMLWPPNFERGEAYTRAFLSPVGLPRLADAQHGKVYGRWNVRARLSGSWRQAEPWVVEEMEKIAQQMVAVTPTGERLLLWEADAGNIMEAALRAALEVGPSQDAVRAALYPEGPEQIHLAIKGGRIRSLNRVISPLLLDRTDIYITNKLI
ncbi:MAG: hypothetical protein H0T73_17385, partial [Ardenticatenales bacterium]|nr:hypothetical protein [Ardenticatenales bacterium]